MNILRFSMAATVFSDKPAFVDDPALRFFAFCTR